MGHRIDVGGGGEQPEIDHGAAVRHRVGAARLVVIDVGRIRNDHRAGVRDLVEQTLLVLGAAQIDAIGLTVDTEFLASQLAPVRTGVEATAEVCAGAGELPGQVVGDLVRVHDQTRQLLA